MRGFSFKRKFFREYGDKFLFTICVVVFLVGVIIGAITISASNGAGNLYAENFALQIISNKENFTIIENFSATIIEDLTTYIILLFLALSCIGTPIILLIPLFKGVNIGIIFACLYKNYGFSGIVKITVLFLPHTVISSIVMFFLSIYAFKSSVNLFNTYILKGKRILLYNPINIIKLFLLSSLVSFIYCIMECVVSLIF